MAKKQSGAADPGSFFDTQAYGPSFAVIYDRLWGGFAETFASVLYSFTEDHRGAGLDPTVLDLGCGTGHLASYFLDRGYYVTALDKSFAMAERARMRLSPHLKEGQGSVLHEDMTIADLDKKFSFVFSTYDTINHLETKAQLVQCFSRVRAHLLPGGYFVFDLNTARGLERWNGVHVEEREDYFILNRGIFDPHRVVGEYPRAQTKLSAFIQMPEGYYNRLSSVVYNSAFPLEEVRGILRDQGFDSIDLVQLPGLNGFEGDPEDQGRVVFICS